MLHGNDTGQPETDVRWEYCVTKHDGFAAMTNRSVLLQVAPLLTDRKTEKDTVAAVDKL